MHCPQCRYQQFTIAAACPDCGFTGDLRLLERLSNLNFVLTESETWGLVRSLLQPIQTRYQKQQREVEVSLGLRRPPATAAEARLLRLELAKFTYLQYIIPRWQQKKWLSAENGRQLLQRTQIQINNTRAQLQDAPPVNESSTLTKRLMLQWDQLDFARQTIEELYESGQLINRDYRLALAEIEAQIIEVEYKAGMRERPKAKPIWQPATKDKAATVSAEPDDIPLQPSRPPRQPWTWDRFWESLLSERTLKAILFLGAMLLFAAAVSWVASNWNNFTPLIQGTFLVSVTAVFYSLGWFVRVKRGLHESGVAISAVASFLVPLDFLVYYLSGGFPPQSWPTIWLAASLVCFGLYLLMTISLQAEFFGYLVALAATSLVVSLLNWFQVPFDWWQTGIVATALALAIASTLCRTAKADWRIFAPSLGRMALVTAVPTMFLGLGWSIIVRDRSSAFYLALALSWWLGGGMLALMSRQYRLRSLVLATALTFPIAVWLTLDWTAFSRATFALGWAALTPLYLTVGYRLWQQADDEAFQSYSRIVLGVGWLIIALAAVWPLTNPAIARFVHLWLAVTMVLAAYLWQQSRHLWLMTLFLMMAATMWQGSLGAAPVEVTLSWSLLAILHVATAVWLDSKQLSVRSKHYSASLFGAGWVLAGLALLPPLLFGERAMLAYALGNWIGLNGWLAFVANGWQHSGLQTFLHHPWLQRLPSQTFFQWLTALSILPWLGLVWSNRGGANEYLSLAYMLLAWGLLVLGLRLRRLHWAYSAPWHVTAHLGTLAALALAMVYQQQPVFATVTLAAAIFHFASTWLMPRWRWLGLFIGGLLLPIGWLSGLDWLGVSSQVLLPVLAAMVLLYLSAAKALEDLAGYKKRFTDPLETAAMLLAGLVVVWSLLNGVQYWDNDLSLIWVALASAFLAASFLLYAWQHNMTGWGHLGIWAGVVAGGLVIKTLSRGSGRSAALAALLAIALIVAERCLRHYAVQPKSAWRLWWRRAWRLYRRPLLTAGWLVSAGTIGLALARNLILLGGGIGRQSWSILALFLITGLYALSAHFYKKERFVWFASILVIAPWTLLANLRWYLGGRLAWEWYGGQWVLLGILLLLAGVLKIRSAGGRSHLHLRSSFGFAQDKPAPLLPPLIIAHVLVPLALAWGLAYADASSVALGLGILFYGAAVWIDYHFRDKGTLANNRFLFPAAILLPAWAVYLLFWLVPQPAITTVALLVLAFSLPLLAAGRWLRGWQSGYQWPLYLVAYGTAVCATVMLLNEPPFLIGVLLFNTGLALLSAYLFRKPHWLAAATVLFPWAAWLILAQIGVEPHHYYGWLLILIGAFYLWWAWILRTVKLHIYGQPLLAAMFGLVALGILLSGQGGDGGAMVGYGMAAVVWGITAVWLRQPVLLYAVAPLLAGAYKNGVDLLAIPAPYLWLAGWPGIIALLGTGWYLDNLWGIEPQAGQPKQLGRFPWYAPWHWPTAVEQRVRRWWALPLDLTAMISTFYFTLSLIPLLQWPTQDLADSLDLWQFALVLGLGTAVYTYSLFRYRVRGLLLLAWFWLQLSYITTLTWFFPDADSFAAVALAFMPMTMGTAAMGLLIQFLREEAAPFGGGLKQWWFGWSRPFFAILALNLTISQLMTGDNDGTSVIVTLLNALIIGCLATYWRTGWLVYIPLALGWLASSQYLAWLNLPQLALPTAFAIMTALYGIIGYSLLYWQIIEENALRLTPLVLRLWQRPLRHTAWFLSAITLLYTLGLGGDVLLMLPFAIFDLPVITTRTLEQANMLVQVFAILGLFYLAAAVVRRRRWLGYGSIWLMLSAWSLWLLYVQGQTELQLYALPASIYLFGVGWLEWTHGSRNLAGWIDRAAIVLMFGAAFWQSFGQWGLVYAVLMMLEGLALVWLGSVRRLRRLLYAGVGGVVTAVVGQLIEPLVNLETYVFLILGAALLAAGILIEQRREKVLQLANELKLKLEDWE